SCARARRLRDSSASSNPCSSGVPQAAGYKSRHAGRDARFVPGARADTLPLMSTVLAIDAGTTGITALVIDERGSVVARGQREFAQIFPHPGWIEHDPEAIWEATLIATRAALDAAGMR